ncbi:hypothetical protein Q5L94_02395 [Idiomarina sp. Sol25]|uniref:hypothetical protein n=1 Tax=Idiomarina sp. Sol25 TaxID=3064000 RepID=UPI00294B20D4|nr:hypothetical protein [Idiomarina sp. Sol25]MDV6326889.1 hypothetical protein [Idiomarina sp. Sol25]
MKTYFIRHSSALAIDKATMDELWQQDRVAIHYPVDNSGNFGDFDSESLDPDDYSGSAKSNLQRFKDLARHGGYVFAAYRGKPGGKVGVVEPGSSVEIHRGKWKRKGDLPAREAILKSIKLNNKKARELNAGQAISLTAVQPRQGTFCQWHKVGSRVADLVEGNKTIVLGSLTPDLQEVMCMEYMRTQKAAENGLPQLEYTVMPVGRTMKDIDILGVDKHGKMVSVQVTFEKINPTGKKLQKLDQYRMSGHKTVYFCNCDTTDIVNGHLVYPLKNVFTEFCEHTQTGKKWLQNATLL